MSENANLNIKQEGELPNGQKETEAQTEEAMETLMAEAQVEIEQTPVQERTKLRKEKFLVMFEKTLGIIGAACKFSGISRNTYYEWREQDPEFKKSCDKILYTQPGAVEDKLLQAIANNNSSSIHFYLSRKHQDYKQKVELEGAVVTTYDGLSNEQIFARVEAIKQRLDRRRGNNEAGADTVSPTNGAGGEERPASTGA